MRLAPDECILVKARHCQSDLIHIKFQFARRWLLVVTSLHTKYAFYIINLTITTLLSLCQPHVKMHPSPYIGAGSGYNRQFHYYSDVNYPPHDFNQYSQHHEKYWLGWPSMPTQVTIEPHDHDVLLGRGGRNNQHTGNDILRQFGRVQGENYRVASKKGKSAISRLLVRQMRELNPPARYVPFR